MRRALLAALIAVVGCGGSNEAEEPLGTNAAKVINGVVDTPAKYDSTILIQTDIGGGMGAGCTGTLITPHVVITARHCVSQYSYSSGFGANYDPNKMYIWYGSEPRGTPDNTVVKIVHNGAKNIDDNDFAMLVLKEPATKIPFSPIRLAKPPVKSETVAVAGYGLTTTDTATPTELHKRYRRENLKIAYVGPIPMYRIGANEIVLGESICQGDSGGPVYDQSTKALLAVTSRGGNGQREDPTKPYAGCVGTQTINYFTRVDAFADMINTTVGEQGEVIWEEGTDKPVQPQCNDAKPCADGLECRDSVCVDPGAPPDPTNPDDPGTDPAGEPAPQTTTVQTGGCAMGASSADASAVLGMLALALVVARRRR